MINRLFRDYFELLFWLGALVALGISDPTQPPHYTLCPLKMMGIAWCPGCGLGHSIAFLLHGDIPRSWHAHWLGIPALGVIAYRIVDLVKQRMNEAIQKRVTLNPKNVVMLSLACPEHSRRIEAQVDALPARASTSSA